MPSKTSLPTEICLEGTKFGSRRPHVLVAASSSNRRQYIPAAAQLVICTIMYAADRDIGAIQSGLTKAGGGGVRRRR
jgi:hypothetical protein